MRLIARGVRNKLGLYAPKTYKARTASQGRRNIKTIGGDKLIFWMFPWSELISLNLVGTSPNVPIRSGGPCCLLHGASCRVFLNKTQFLIEVCTAACPIFFYVFLVKWGKAEGKNETFLYDAKRGSTCNFCMLLFSRFQLFGHYSYHDLVNISICKIFLSLFYLNYLPWFRGKARMVRRKKRDLPCSLKFKLYGHQKFTV